MASYVEAIERSTAYFAGDEFAAKVFVGKYALTNPSGDIEEPTPDFMHRRLAKEFARIEAKYANPLSEAEIFSMFNKFRLVVPQGSPMSGIGNPYQTVSLSNCFVIDGAFDSYGGIMHTDQEQAQIMKRRGGVGHDVSNIRPRGLSTSNAAKTTDGIGVFMERFSRTCREVAQGGRRGALMLTISVHHPEIRTFINIKKDKTKVTGANISIRLTDEFMQAVLLGGAAQLRWPVESLDPQIVEYVNAKELWDEIIDAAWSSAEPGLLFWDTITTFCPADAYPQFRTISTNPCSELTLSAYDSCRLLLLNAYGFVKNPFTAEAAFDFDLFAEMAQKSQRLMDDLVDMELECIDKILAKIKSDPEPDAVKGTELDMWLKIRTACEDGRRTGLGMTAIGDMLAALGMRYGSPEAIAMTEAVYKALAINSYKSSCVMAGERGTFPAFSFENEAAHPFIQKVVNADPELKRLYLKYGRRNIANTTTAPAGSVSAETQSTSGIEPAFLLAYTRRKKINPNDKDARVDFTDEQGDKWQEFKVYHHKFQTWMDVTGKTAVEDSPYYKSTSNDVDWAASVDLQAAAQRWTCHAISKTVNLPNSATKETVAEVYMRGWKTGCKGITVYRDGCRTGVLLSEETLKNQKGTQTFEEHNAPKRPAELPCQINHVSVKGQPYTVIVGLMDGKPYEVFGGHPIKDLPKHFKEGRIVKVSHGKSKPATYNLHVKNGHEEVIEDINSAFDNPTQGAFTRLLSTALRHGTPVQYVAEQVQKGEKDSSMTAFSKVIGRVLKHYIKDGTVSSDKTCPSCKQDSLIYQEGCPSCKNCGYGKCANRRSSPRAGRSREVPGVA
jgi:ribonucleoside-diphosphate reductase alpha chain